MLDLVLVRRVEDNGAERRNFFQITNQVRVVVCFVVSINSRSNRLVGYLSEIDWIQKFLTGADGDQSMKVCSNSSEHNVGSSHCINHTNGLGQDIWQDERYGHLQIKDPLSLRPHGIKARFLISRHIRFNEDILKSRS